ncbi:flagellar hook-associated protein FlgK [Ectobacillus antri]|uniref:flagellar hook-associated protein FlgK n=1 Tax=Ectobacillus antri TaxID=2486280 RepID=UPI000F5B80D5|nr:flagellar hook-associated protein FlgK [Ectobacillus antri]
MKLSEYNTSLSGLMAAQLGISTTKQNITNLQSDHYVRQKVNMSALGAVPDSPGHGVKVLGIERVVDDIKTGQYNKQLSAVSYYEYMKTGLMNVESMFHASGDNGLSTRIDRFLQAWHEISKNPTQSTYYQTVVSEGVKFASELNRVATDLRTAKGQAQEDLQASVQTFNRIAGQLANINKRIADASTVPNQLLNERDQLISELSTYAQVEIGYESLNPNIPTIRVGGMIVVSGTDAIPITLQNGIVQLNDKPALLQGGRIKAAEELDKHTSAYLEELDTFSNNFTQKVNDIAGQVFFEKNGNTLQINPTFVSNAFSLALSAEKAEQIAQLKNTTIPSGITYQKAMDQLSVKIATDTNTATSQHTIHEEVLQGIDKDKRSVEGVNLDEEMVNLMMYQNYFTANSKAIRVIDELYDTLFGILS